MKVVQEDCLVGNWPAGLIYGRGNTFFCAFGINEVRRTVTERSERVQIRKSDYERCQMIGGETAVSLTLPLTVSLGLCLLARTTNTNHDWAIWLRAVLRYATQFHVLGI